MRMGVRERLSLILLPLLFLSSVRAETPFRFREVKISPTGRFLGIDFTLHTFDITISDSGRVESVKITAYGDSPMEYRFTEDKIERVQKGLVSCEFDGEKLVKVGDYSFRYLSAYPGRLEAVGDTVITYESSGGKPGRIERFGALQIIYSLAEKRIDLVGSLKFEYRRQDGFLERFTRTFRREGEPVVGVRICSPEGTR